MPSRASGRSPAVPAIAVLVWTTLAACAPGPAGAAEGSNIERARYLSPRPGSQRVSPWNNVVIRFGESIDAASLEAGQCEVTGTRSGRHDGVIVLADDGRSIVFTPREPFAPGERVNVRFAGGARTRAGERLPAIAFGFEVASIDPTVPRPDLSALHPELRALEAAAPAPPAIAPPPASCLPADYPPVQVLRVNDPDPGHVFVAPFTSGVRGGMLVLDNAGEPLFYRGNPNRVFDFKLQPNGLLTYFDYRQTFWALDSTYAVVDSFRMGNGYIADAHDLQILPDGHALMMAYDVQPVGMDTVVAGGDPNALVVGLIVQELDAAGNVVFQWRSWDHFEITDADTCMVNMHARLVDYVHGNTVERDADGNLLISCRSMHEITKIDRDTGEILWRLGLNAKHNEFTFTNDTRGWTAQHDVRRLANGNLLLFDNGNCQDSLYSRVLEYDINEHAKKAKLVWSYRNSPDTYAPFMGNVQRRANGATMVGWGGTQPNPKLTDLHPDGTVAFELGFPAATTYSYRSFRFPWDLDRLSAGAESLHFGLVNAGETAEQPLVIRNHSNHDFTITCLHATSAWFSVTDGLPRVIAPGDSATLIVRFAPDATGDVVADLYARSVADTELVAERVATVTGSGFGITGAGDRAASGRFALHPARPSPFRDETTVRFELPQPGWVSLEVFDLQGRKVDTLAEGMRPAGVHEARWRVRGAPAGVYFYRLRSGAFAETRRLVRVR